MARDLRFTARALKDLKGIATADAERIRGKLRQFADRPDDLANQVKRLSDGRMRLRVGDYRAILTEELVVVTVLRVGHRSRVYDL